MSGGWHSLEVEYWNRDDVMHRLGLYVTGKGEVFEVCRNMITRDYWVKNVRTGIIGQI